MTQDTSATRQETTASAGGRTIDKKVEVDHKEEHHSVPRQREKKGFFGRMFGG